MGWEADMKHFHAVEVGSILFYFFLFPLTDSSSVWMLHVKLQFSLASYAETHVPLKIQVKDRDVSHTSVLMPRKIFFQKDYFSCNVFVQ